MVDFVLVYGIVKFCLDRVFVATSQNYCRISEYVIAENHGIDFLTALALPFCHATFPMHRGMTENILS